LEHCTLTVEALEEQVDLADEMSAILRILFESKHVLPHMHNSDTSGRGGSE
jgi:hypothetical protein